MGNFPKSMSQDNLSQSERAPTEPAQPGRLLASIMEQAREGYAVFNEKDLSLQTANPAFRRFFGIQTVEGITLTSLFPEIDQTLEQQASFERIQDLSGVTLPLEVGVSRVRLEQNGYWLVTARDITSDKQAERTLRQQLDGALLRNRIIELAASTRDPEKILETACRELCLALHIPHAGIASFNQSSTRLQVVASYCEGKRPDTIGTMLPVANNAAIHDFLKTRVLLSIEDAHSDLRAGGWQSLTGQEAAAILVVPLVIRKRIVGVLEMDAPEPRSFSQDEISLVEDIAAAASHALEAAQLREKLQKALRQREKYLQQLKTSADELDRKNSELAETRDRAIEASRTVADFLAFMSHEIRTPVTSMVGMTELLLTTRLDPEQHEYASVALDSAEMLLSLLDKVLDLSKIEAGQMTLDKVRFEPLSLVESAADLFSAQAWEKGISLMTYVSPKVPFCLMGDPVRLRQVLVNLISNAIKFTETGEVNIVVELAEQCPEGTSLRFEVQDTGIGIPLDRQKAIFERFTQADRSIASRFGGTGLGLAISKRFVELMGGQLTVESIEGQGSTFHFTVPYPTCESTAAALSQPIRVSLNGMRILLVDSNPRHREILRAYLESWGMRCSEAGGVAEAISLMQTAFQAGDPYPITILDDHLMDGTGFDLARRIEQHEELAATHLILIAPFDQRGQNDDALRMGFSAVLNRPIKQSLLYDAIANAIASQPFQYHDGIAQPESGQPVFRTARSQGFAIDTSVDSLEKGLVLLAEDNHANQRLGIVQLQKLGYQVETAETGKQAVERLLSAPERYALVLMDCQMPDMDGMDATRLIREREEQLGIHTPIIAMTANALKGDREACLEAGMDDYISKPVSIADLRKVTGKWAQLWNAAADQVNRPTPGPSQPVLDLEVLKEIRELQVAGEPDFLTELIDMFLRDSRAVASSIRKVMESGKLKEMRRPVHSLKGTSANLGAALLPALCTEIEAMIEKGDLPAVRSFLPAIEAEYERVRTALERERQPSSG